jgi:DNA-directed RNA polymerase specialized sigma24 family protein
VITDDLASVWPEVAARLRSMLRRRGVRHHDIDEIVQETATRVITSAVPYADADDLFRWASVVGGRLAIDLRRRGARLSGEELPDRADTIDVADAAEHRVVLGAVRNRLRELSSRDQEVLLSSLHDEPASSRRESVRMAVARHRARNRLRVLLDGLAGSALLAWLRRSRFWSAPVEAIAYAAMPTAACVLITMGVWGGSAHHRPNDQGQALTAATQVVPVPAASSTASPSTRAAGPVDGGASSSPSRPPSVPPLQDPYVIVDEPSGAQTRAGLRDKQESDHVWCLTSPSLSGPEERCVDPPVTVPLTP